MTENCEKFGCGVDFFGTVTVDEQGEIIVPLSARKLHGIEPGDTFLMTSGADDNSMMLCTLETFQDLIASFREGLMHIKLSPAEAANAE